MPIDPRRRQKKIERRRAKEKAQRRKLAKVSSGGIAIQLRAAAQVPILHCCMMREIWSQGIGQVMISRQFPNGQVACVSFLVDRYCLGVKDVLMTVLPRWQYQEGFYEQMAARFSLVSMKPECARKFVEGAVEYARNLGLPPHRDYQVAKLIFGDIRAEDCSKEFEYGLDGKPLFIPGPNDSMARCKEILATLDEHCGEGGYDYLIHFSPE